MNVTLEYEEISWQTVAVGSQNNTHLTQFQSNAELGKILTSYLFNAYVGGESWTQQKTSSTRFKGLKI